MSIKRILFDLRSDYTKFKFTKKTARTDPFEQFDLWFKDVLQSSQNEPNAMSLSTVSEDCKPSSRIVLLKQYDQSGFVFFTNYESQKGNHLAQNPNASLLFFWDQLERQVRIEGVVEKLSYDDSDSYYQTRPYTSRIGAWASRQSQVLQSRLSLMKKVAMLMAKYPKKVPLPPFWGGYILKPVLFEFWQGRESRLHDRIRYKYDDGIWKIDRLYP